MKYVWSHSTMLLLYYILCWCYVKFYVDAHFPNPETWYVDASVTFYVDAMSRSMLMLLSHSMLMLCHILCWCSCPKSRDMVCWCFGHILCWCYTTFYVDAMSHSMLMLMSQIQRHGMLMLLSHSMLMLYSILCWCSCPKSRDMVCWCFGHILCWCYTKFYVDAMTHSMLVLMSQIQRHSMLMLVSHSMLMLMSQIQRHGMVIHMSYSIG